MEIEGGLDAPLGEVALKFQRREKGESEHEHGSVQPSPNLAQNKYPRGFQLNPVQ